MKRIFIGLILLCTVGCNNSPTKSDERLPAPIFLTTPADTSLIEKGIDADDSGNFIQLDWEPGDASNPPLRYRIYRKAEDEDSFKELGAGLSGNQTTFTDTIGSN